MMFLKGQCSHEYHAALMYLASGVLAMKYFSFMGRPNAIGSLESRICLDMLPDSKSAKISLLSGASGCRLEQIKKHTRCSHGRSHEQQLGQSRINS